MDGFIKRYRLSLLVVLLMLINEGLTQNSVSGDPVITNFPSDYAVLGQTYTATCSASGGVPKPTLRWYRNNVLQKSSTPTSDVTQTLEYAFEAKEGDNNIAFKCVSENSEGTPSVTATINVIWARPFIHPTLTASSPTIVTGSSYSWTCKVDNGYPAPNVYWTLKGNNYFKTDSHVQETIEPAGTLPYNVTSVFTLNPVTSDYNGETLMCRVERKFSLKDDKWDLNTTATLDVHGPPTVSISPSSKSGMLGSDIGLLCMINTRLSTYQVQWYKIKQGGNENITPKSDKYTLSTNGQSLGILNVVLDDAGGYYCTGTAGGLTSANSNTVQVTVYKTPDTPIITRVNQVYAGLTATFTCLSDNGYPQPSISWSIDGITNLPQSWAHSIISNSQTSEGYYSMTSRLTFIASMDVHNKLLACTVTQTGPTPRTISIKLVVYELPTVAIGQASLSAVAGEDVNITCTVNFILAFEVEWYLVGGATNGGDKLLVSGSDYTVSTDGTVLTVIDVGTQDEGQYYCKAKNDDVQSLDSNQASILLKPIVSVTPASLGVTLGSNALFNCVVVSKVATTISWFKENIANELASGSDYTVSGNSLLVLNVQFADEGKYYCEASSSVGKSASSRAELSVIPSVSISPTSPYNSQPGGTVILTCTVSSTLSSTVSWFYIESSSHVQIQTKASKYELVDRKLTISNVVSEDERSYYCKATSTAGTSNPSNQVVIQVAPTVSATPSSQGVNVDGDAQFTCAAVSSLQITSIQWYKSGSATSITPGGQFVIDMVTTTGNRLTITKVTQSNAGTYYCRATSAAGSTNSNLVTLNLKPDVSITPSSVNVQIGSGTTLTCNIGSQTSITVTWYKEATPTEVQITASSKYEMTSLSTLKILDLSIADEGKYYCRVRNTVTNEFSNSDSATLTVYNTPSNPSLAITPEVILVGTAVTAKCTTNLGYPKPTIQWLLNDIVQSSNAITTSDSFADSTKFTVESEWKFSGNLQDTNKVVTCRVSHSQSLGSSHLTVNKTLVIHVKPRVSIDPASSGKNPGEEAKFTCTVQSTLDTTVNWFKTSTTSAALSTNSKYILSGNTLTVKVVALSDDDNYYCQARNQAGLSDFSNAVHLIVIPTVSALPTAPEILIGQDVTLTCTVTTKTVATVKWYNTTDTSNPIVAVVNKIELTGNNLVIKSVKTGDIGNYYCKATNAGGSSPNSNVVDLKVYNTPQLVGTLLQSPSVLTNGQNAVFTCNTQNGYPEPTITWQLAGSSVSSGVTSEKTLTEFGYQKTSRLTLVASTATHNTKELTCIVSQSKLNTPLTAKTTLAVHSSPTGIVSLTSPAASTNVGQSATLKCTVSSSLTATVKWRFERSNPVSVNDITASLKYVLTTSSLDSDTLTITSLVVSDDGNYTCIVTSTAGSSDSTPFSLTVHSKPSVLTITSSTLVINEGSTIDATCKATANPQDSVTYKWTKGSTVVAQTAQLLFTNADRTKDGTYKCTATTQAGFTESDPVTFDVQYKPAAVTNLQTEFSGAASSAVTLTCNTDADPIPTTYRWTKNNVVETTATSRTYQVTVDSATTTYTCEATNTRGTSDPITFTVIQTSSGDGNLPGTGAASTAGGTGLSSGAIAAIVLAIIFIILIIIVIIVCCISHGVCGTKKVTKKVKPQSERRIERRAPSYDNEYLTPYDFTKHRATHMEPAAISRTHVEVDVPSYHNSNPKHSRGTHRSNFYRNAPPIAVESENGTIISVSGDKDQLMSGKFGQLPPLDDKYTYYKEEELRKKRRKKRKRQQQERESGVGQESPRREKRRHRRHENPHPARNGIPPQDLNGPPTTNGMPPGDITVD